MALKLSIVLRFNFVGVIEQQCKTGSPQESNAYSDDVSKNNQGRIWIRWKKSLSRQKSIQMSPQIYLQLNAYNTDKAMLSET